MAEGRMFRGQVSALDALIAFTVFALAVGLYLDSGSQLRENSLTSFQPVLAQAQRASYQLTESPGDPTDWNQTNFRQVGLARKRGVIDGIKLDSLLAADWVKVKDVLGASSYNLMISLVNASDGSVIKSGGDYVQPNSTLVAPFSTPVVYNGGVCELEVTLWN